MTLSAAALWLSIYTHLAWFCHFLRVSGLFELRNGNPKVFLFVYIKCSKMCDLPDSGCLLKRKQTLLLIQSSGHSDCALVAVERLWTLITALG